MKRAIAALVALWCVLGSAASASAVERSYAEDPNDTAGRLDASLVRFAHPAGEPASWSMFTYARWTTRSMWDAGFFWVELDTRGTAASDYYVLVRSDRSKIVGGLFRVGAAGKHDVRLRGVDTWRDSSKHVGVHLPLRALTFADTRTTFRWWAETTFVGDACPRSCLDQIPDDPADAPSQDVPGGPPP